MTVSCIIPCYNAAKTIRRSVYSVLAQTKPIDEIIIIDDGSDDDSNKILNELDREVKQLQVISQPNKGVSAARNLGITVSSHPYLLMLDADDVFHPEYLERASSAIASDDGIAMIMCGYRIIQSNKVRDIRHPRNGTFEDFLFSNSGLGNGLFSKIALVDVGCYDEQMLDGYEDWELHIRLKKHNWEFKVLSEVLFDYSYEPNSRNKSALRQDSKIKNYLFGKYKSDYIQNYDRLVGQFQEQLERTKDTILKREQSLDFRIGRVLLMPLRWIKKLVS